MVKEIKVSNKWNRFKRQREKIKEKKQETDKKRKKKGYLLFSLV